MEGKELIEKNAALSLNDDKVFSKAFYESGIFKDVKNEAQALVKIIAGREQGLTPIQSMMNVYIFDDKVMYYIKVFLAKIKKSKKYNYKIKQSTDKLCEIDFYENGKLSGTSKFDFSDAAKAGLPNKDSYKKYPNIMLFYRCASNGIKMYCPDILDGCAIYEDFAEQQKEIKTMTVDLETGEIKEEESNSTAPEESAAVEAEIVEEQEEETAEDIFK